MKTCFQTQKGPGAVGPYSTCVATQREVYVSGMIPLDPATNQLVPGGIEEQARQALTNIQTVLEEMGLSMAHVVKTTVLLTNLDDFAAVNAIYDGFFAPDYPARACYEVSRLPKGARIEIEAVAAKEA